MSIFHWMIFINLTKAYKKVLWVLDALLNLYIIWFVTMSFDLELPVVNTMKWQILTHDCRKATIISRLTYFVSFYFKVAVLRILNNFIWEIFNFDAQIKVFKVKKCVQTSRLKPWFIYNLIFIKYFRCYIELNCFKYKVIIKKSATFNLCHQLFNIKLWKSYIILC